MAEYYDPITDKWDPGFAQEVADSIAVGNRSWPPTPEELLAGIEAKNGSDSTDLGHLASTVKMEPIRWLWHGRLALGMLSGLDGDPDLGKSQMVAYEAATVTTGRKWMDDRPCPKGGVVLVSAEDPDASVLVPRLTAAGADLERVLILSTVTDGREKPRLISLPKDVDLLRMAIQKVGALLIVFDPITSYISIDLNANADQPVRQALTPLAEMLDEVHCAGQMLRHHSKNNKVSNALYRGLGSIAFNALARTAMVVAKDKEQKGSYVLAMTKSNIAAKPKARRYGIEGVILEGEIETAHIVWGEETDHQAEELTTAFGAVEKKKDAAEALLLDLLTDGPKLSKEIFEAFERAGISRDTAFETKKRMGIKAQKQGFDGPWEWTLTDSSKSRLGEEDLPRVGTDPSAKDEESLIRISTDSSTLPHLEESSEESEESKDRNPRAREDSRPLPQVRTIKEKFSNRDVVVWGR